MAGPSVCSCWGRWSWSSAIRVGLSGYRWAGSGPGRLERMCRGGIGPIQCGGCGGWWVRRARRYVGLTVARFRVGVDPPVEASWGAVIRVGPGLLAGVTCRVRPWGCGAPMLPWGSSGGAGEVVKFGERVVCRPGFGFSGIVDVGSFPLQVPGPQVQKPPGRTARAATREKGRAVGRGAGGATPLPSPGRSPGRRPVFTRQPQREGRITGRGGPRAPPSTGPGRGHGQR